MLFLPKLIFLNIITYSFILSTLSATIYEGISCRKIGNTKYVNSYLYNICLSKSYL